MDAFFCFVVVMGLIVGDFGCKHEEIDRLLTKEGRGCKPKIDNILDKFSILESIKSNL